ncbi:MAG TPA: substrate-binding domain-containing protein [Solirubrobacterales bacterium]|nr:substrate-binding domain-containing protein [Solirubrobacterales bacterium]
MKIQFHGRFRPRVLHVVLAVGVLVLAVALAACGGSGSSSSSTESSSGGESSGSSSGEAPGLAQANSFLEEFQQGSAEWKGPMSGPKLSPSKKIAYVAYDDKNEQVEAWESALKEVAGKIGWELDVLDGQGTTTGEQSALDQAISLKPDGIILGSMPESFAPYFLRAEKAGIAVVGVNSDTGFGAFPKEGIAWNVMQDPSEVAKALTDWVISKSAGKARVILTTDPAFAIVKEKTKAMQEALKPCTECELLEFLQVPFETAESRVPGLITNWVSKYGSGGPVYLLQPSDFFVDYEVPSLRSAGVEQGQFVLTGMDGPPPAYERIRNGDEYQEVTVPIPTQLEAYQLIDALNRLFNNSKPTGDPPPGYVVDKETIETAGGKNNEFVPASGYAKHYEELWNTGKTTAK